MSRHRASARATDIYEPEHEDFRRAFRAFLETEAVPFVDEWESAGRVPDEFFRAAGRAGFLGFEFPVEHGGVGVDDFRFNAIMTEEVVASGAAGDTFSIQNDILVPYLAELTTEEQKSRWLPAFTAGECVTAIAMSEPGAGSDLSRIRTRARLDGDTYVVDGEKTFITNGNSCDLVIVLTRTGEDGGRGMSLIAVEAGTPGFTKSQPFRKVGRHGQDTAALTFEACRVPVGNLVGVAGQGFPHAMANLPRERLSIALLAVASAEHALSLALEHCRRPRQTAQ